jgi:ABC-type Fe3+-hydroxamate transport system substrate-binding protein
MKWMIMIALCFALLSAGCVEQKSVTNNVKSATSTVDKAQENLTVTITSPQAGEILQGNNDVSFASNVSGGKKPLSYRWSSSIDGELSTSQSFQMSPSKLSKGGHVIILTVTDASGSSTQGTVQIEAM